MNKYLFTSQRLGFRPWTNDDLGEFSAMNADPRVMQYFPKTLNKDESKDFLDRLHKHNENHGYCYFATEIIETSELIGFI